MCRALRLNDSHFEGPTVHTYCWEACEAQRSSLAEAPAAPDTPTAPEPERRFTPKTASGVIYIYIYIYI